MKPLVFKSKQTIIKEIKVKQVSPLVQQRENLPPSRVSINSGINLLLDISELGKRLKLYSAGVLTVLLVYRSYVLHGVGLTVWELVKLCKMRDGYFTSMHDRIRRLVKGGFLEIGGTGKNHAIVFIPTDYLIAEIETIFK